MKPEIEVLVTNRLRRQRLIRKIAPSLRIAATIHNRSLLRWLRAVESLAWQDADMPRRLRSRVASKKNRVRSNLLKTADCETL